MIYRNPREQEIYDLSVIISNVGTDIAGKQLMARHKHLHTVDTMVRQAHLDSVSEQLKRLNV